MPPQQLVLPVAAAAVVAGSVAAAIWKLRQSVATRATPVGGGPSTSLNFANVKAAPPPLPDDALAFLSEYTGITNFKQLRKTVLAVWAKVKATQHIYGCIQAMSFLTPRVQLHSIYPKMIAAHKEAVAASAPFRVAEIGCCFGQDVRKLVVDGVPTDSILAIDVSDGYWNAGKEIFLDTGNAYSKLAGVHTLFGDLGSPGSDMDTQLASAGYVGTFNFAYSLAVLHVLSKAQVRALLTRVHSMLVPGTGTLFGWTAGSSEAREWALTPDGKAQRYLHSQESLTALLEELGYVDVVVADAEPWMYEYASKMATLANAAGQQQSDKRWLFSARRK